MTPTQPNTQARQGVLDALGHLHDEADRWTLSEALLTAAPQNVSNRWFQEMFDEATNKGVPTISVSSMRQYRDMAVAWPEDKRVKGASFTAHREAQVLGSADAEKLLADMVAQEKADPKKKVTASKVRAAVLAAQGKANPAAAKKAVATVSLSDLVGGGQKLIDAIRGAGLDASGLDKLHAGLTAVITEVEGLRIKAARKSGAQAAKAKAKATPPPVPQPVPPVSVDGQPSGADESGRAVGDLRGL